MVKLPSIFKCTKGQKSEKKKSMKSVEEMGNCVEEMEALEIEAQVKYKMTWKQYLMIAGYVVVLGAVLGIVTFMVLNPAACIYPFCFPIG